jgi:hypothetical protein
MRGASVIDDALFLWRHGRRESGLLLACVAIAGRARREYPTERDRAAFTRVLREAQSVQLSVEFRNRLEKIEDLLYTWVRCELVHTGEMPIDIEIDDQLGDGLVVRAGGSPEYLLKLSPGWFDHLLSIARQPVEGTHADARSGQHEVNTTPENTRKSQMAEMPETGS